jgi:hypothetical protein
MPKPAPLARTRNGQLTMLRNVRTSRAPAHTHRYAPHPRLAPHYYCTLCGFYCTRVLVERCAAHLIEEAVHA